ncbi:MAG: helix-turn-helix domain-containing protein [Lachnoclostridium sp.]|nr:helix-turn-helix domain-containing protein [Lachnoclostridium sp.]
MLLSYDKLWKLLIDRKMKKTELKNIAGLSPNTLAKLGKDEIVNMQSLLKICDTLSCTLDEIVEYSPNDDTGETI